MSKPSKACRELLRVLGDQWEWAGPTGGGRNKFIHAPTGHVLIAGAKLNEKRTLNNLQATARRLERQPVPLLH